MQYFGGKARVGQQIADYLSSVRKPGQTWVEPFCGGLWVTYRAGGERRASDANEAVVTLYSEIQKGWVPPASITEEVYAKYKGAPDAKDPMTAFVGIGCSFGGKWFGGFARSADRNYATNAKNSLLKKVEKCKDVTFFHADYKEALLSAPQGSLVYLDPPYANTTGYDGTGSFDSGQFWGVVRKVAEEHDVYVSEYTAPPDFKCVLELKTKTDMRVKDGSKQPRVERLYTFPIRRRDGGSR
jgi:DNA adenine methylase